MTFGRKRALKIAVGVAVAIFVLPVILWFGFPYLSYRIYMAWLASGVHDEYGNLPAPLVEELRPHYARDLSQATYARTTNLPTHLAVADCSTIYFGDPRIVADLRAGRELTTGELRWLSHELTHGDQCERWGGRGAFARTWFAQADAEAWTVVRRGDGFRALGEWLRTRYIVGLHDAMPMEEEADARAAMVLQTLGR